MLGRQIAYFWHEWDSYRTGKRAEWRELHEYLYATDTRTTSASATPWKNTTTTPKLTQIRDNLHANYMASMFPKRRWLVWEGADKASQTKDKTDAIAAYMGYVIDYQGFKDTVSKLVLDYIEYGNVFATIDWMDERIERPQGIAAGFVGPVIRRISPLDIVMNPTAPDFYRSPKIIRTMVSLGELQEILHRMSTDDGEREAAEKLFTYLNDIRMRVTTYGGNVQEKDHTYRVEGFTSFRNYLESGYAEILTFVGDLYDRESQTFLKNHIIQVVDQHKVIRNEPNPSDSGLPPVYHSGWRLRQDNLWAMGPLDNLVGLQYRLDHVENAKADYFDLLNCPPLKIKGYVEDFKWAPFEKIYVGDDGDVEVLTTTVNPLSANLEIQELQNRMEEMAGAPKEAMGFRTPGEKTAYEVQKLDNAASRIFQAKIAQFEEQILEPLLNGMLELARRKMDATTIRVIDDEYKAVTFMDLTAEDLMGAGRIRPIAARHFIEVAERIQNVSQFLQGAMNDQLLMQHISSIQLAKMYEELLDLNEFKLIQPFIRVTETAEAQQLGQQHQEDQMMAAQTPSGMGSDWDNEPGQPTVVNDQPQ